MVEIDDLKELPPEERIKRLKQLEDERKREIEQAEKLIRESETTLGRLWFSGSLGAI